MSRGAKNQWDFGELFQQEETRRVLSVGEITAQIRKLLEAKYATLWVTGEVSNLRLQPSGHCYFTLKDADAQLSCVLFRGSGADRELLAEGRKVNLRGAVTVYEARGQYQLRVDAVEAVGLGALQAAFEKLKQKLAAEGLFDVERKRPLPPFPTRIGIVTSSTAAALHDVLHVIERRFAGLEIVIAPSRVQGDGAAREIADGIALLNEFSADTANGGRPLDLILVTRGGGSLEDLWAFNEEAVARAIFTSALPVVSAVGHEIDFTIADFVADVRAATPSAAAEIITAEYVACRDWVNDAGRLLARQTADQLASKRETVDALRRRLERCRPQRRLEEINQRLDEVQLRMVRALKSAVRDRAQMLEGNRRRLAGIRPSVRLQALRERVSHARGGLLDRTRVRLNEQSARLQRVAAQLRLLGPMNALERGYSITTLANGQVVRSAEDVATGDELHTRVRDGTIWSRVQK